MAKEKLHAATLGGSADEIEAAFYEAMQKGELEKLMACWADEDDIVCVHPGSARLLGMQAIRAAYEALFANGSIRAFPRQVRRIESMASAVHNLLERIEVMTPQGPRQAYVIATNVYHKTAQGWRLVAHHASPGTLEETPEPSGPAQVLH